jgi:hypothetical protein
VTSEVDWDFFLHDFAEMVFFIQLAKAEGLEVIASAGSEEKVAIREGWGLSIIKTPDTHGRGLCKKELGPIDM